MLRKLMGIGLLIGALLTFPQRAFAETYIVECDPPDVCVGAPCPNCRICIIWKVLPGGGFKFVGFFELGDC